MNECATVPAGLARRGAPLGRKPACRARQVVLSGLKGEDRVGRWRTVQLGARNRGELINRLINYSVESSRGSEGR